MSTTTFPATQVPAVTGTSTGRYVRAGLVGGLVAAVVNTALVAAVHGAGVSLDIAGESIPLLGFPQLTFVGALLGIGIAAVLRRRATRTQRTFLVTTVVLTALSLIPDITADAGVGTRVLLMATHVVAAAIIVPTIARRLPA